MRSKGRMERDAAAVAVDRPSMLQALGWSSRDAVAFVVAVSAADLDPGQHAVSAAGPASGADGQEQHRRHHAAELGAKPAPPRRPARRLPRARPDEAPAPKAEQAKARRRRTPAAPAAAARPNTAVVADIQRELSRRGFYDGVVDGRYGPRTDASIRDFEQAAGLRPSTEPNEALLRAIQRSPVRSRPAALRPPAPIPQAKPDPIAELIAPSKQVIAVQRALVGIRLRPDQADRDRRSGDAVRDPEVRARAQAAGHRAAVAPRRARARRHHRPAAGISLRIEPVSAHRPQWSDRCA